jgi:hypothetical protein
MSDSAQESQKRHFSKIRPHVLDAFIKIAQFICGGAPPSWLAEQLWRWNRRLHQDRHVEKIRPTRAQMRASLQEIENAALVPADALEHSWAREFLDKAETNPIDNPEWLKRAVEDLAYRANQARDCPDLATVAGTKRGPGKARPEGMSPHTLCAIMILEAWRHIHGAEPSPKSERLANAAEAYWRTAGGEAHSCGDEPLAFWRHHFKKAAGLTAKDFRKEWRRHLVESERQWQRRNSASEAA